MKNVFTCLIVILLAGLLTRTYAQNCTLPVIGGTAGSSISQICPSNGIIVYVEGSSSGTGLTYQWESSPDNTTWTLMQGYTAATMSTVQSQTTWYRRKTICDAGGFAYSTSHQIITKDFNTCYCTPFTTNCATYRITNVNFLTLNNNSTCESGGYSNFSSTVAAANLMQGSYVPIAVTTTNASNGRFVYCYIDYNQNGAFDPKEGTLIFPPTGNVYNGFIKVPFRAKTGVTRMRIIYSSGNNNTCYPDPAGELEDYSINIIPNTTTATGHVIYVKQSAPGSNSSGMSWTNATTSLRNGLSIATAGDTIKMAAGTYYSGTTQSNGTSLIDSVFILGGYPASGNPTNTDRNHANQQTILSGLPNSSAQPNAADYHVLYAFNIKGCEVDGLILQDGGGLYGSGNQDKGGGALIQNSFGMTFRNCVFRNNNMYSKGSAFAVVNSETSFNNCIVTKGNGYYSNIFIDNSQVNFNNLLAASNTGAYLMESAWSTINFRNSTLAWNYMTSGIIIGWDNVQFNFKNSITYYNSIYNASWQSTSFDSTEVRLTNSTANFQNSLTQVYKAGTSLVKGISPKFKDTSSVAGPDGFYFTSDDGFTLTNPCSPALNAGSNADAAGITTDLTGASRIFGSTVDLGAYELQETAVAVPKVIYVNAAANGANNGSSWANAYKDLHRALAACSDTIKIAAGTYEPWKSASNPNFYWFENKRVILGGYPSTGNPTNNDRDHNLHQTKIDGATTTGGTAGFVVRGIGLDSTSIVDGLIFTNTGVENWISDGAVVYMECNNPVISNCVFTGNKRRVFWGKNNKNPLFLNTRVYANATYGNSYGLDLVVLTNSENTRFKGCTFDKNILPTGTSTTGEFGKVLLLDRTNASIDSCFFIRNNATAFVNNFSNPVVTRTQFLKNYAGDRTTDLVNWYSDPKFSNCEFTDTIAMAIYGGVMNNYWSDPEFTDCQFYNARTSHQGGVAYSDSSNARFKNCIFINSVNSFYNKNGSNIELTNCLVSGATYYYSSPAFMYNFRSSPVITNTVVVNGRAGSIGLMINDSQSHPLINNSIFWKNFVMAPVHPNDLANRVEIKNLGNSQPVIQNSMLELFDAGTSGNNTKNIDPRFKNIDNPIGQDSIWFTADDGLQLCDCSPALNSGNNSLASQTTDIKGLSRIFNNLVDRGAYELQTIPGSASNTSYVNAAATGSSSGMNWNDAFTSLQTALQNACADTIKVAAGMYKPAVHYRDSGFYLNRNMVILGSYDASTGLRDVDEHPSILSGDVGIQGDTSDNSFGLMKAFYIDSLTLDGLVFQGTNRNINGPFNNQHALNATYLKYLQVNNSRFVDNYSNSYGSALYISNLTGFELKRTVFKGNKAEVGAGLYYNYNGPGTRIIDCVFENNQANFQGGGVWTGQSGTSFINCVFTANKAMRGAAMLVDNNPDMMVTNCTFADNYLINGGSVGAGIFSEGYAWQGGGAGPFIGNCLFTGNTTLSQAGQPQGTYQDLYYPKFGYQPSGGQLELRIHHSAVSTGPIYYYGGGLIGPSTIVYKNRSNPIGPDGKWFTEDDGLQPAVCSNGIDLGSNTIVTQAKDLTARPRIFNTTVDMGAYEFNGDPTWSQLLNIPNDSIQANKEITDSLGWTHYYKDCKYLMSIKKAGQNIGTIGDGTFELKIVTSPGYSSGTAMNLTSATYNTTGQPWYVMHRYWKVNPTNAVVDSIRVRFPYSNADYNDVVGSNQSVGQHQQLEFFKVAGTSNPFDLNVIPSNFFRYSHAAEPSNSKWTYSQQDSIHLADYFVTSFSGGGGGAWYDATLADLSITGQTVTPSSVGVGGTVYANFTGVNLATTMAAGAHKINIYLSKNDTLTIGSNGDSLVAVQDVASINAASNTGLLTKQITIPCGTSQGTYYLFFVADGLKSVSETNEYNNIVSTSFMVNAAGNIPAPVILASPGGVICDGNSVTLTATATGCTSCNFSWSNGSTGNTITVNTPGVYTVTATNGCSSASTPFTVVVNSVPVVNLSANSNTICEGNNVVLTASGANSYTWSGNGLNANIGASVTATPVSSGVYSYAVTGTSNGCSTTSTINVTVIPKPTIVVSPSDTAICAGSSVNLSASGAASYSWSPATGLNTSTGADVIATPASTISYVVTGTANGCNNSVTRTITVLPQLTPSVSVNVSGCPGNNLTFNATPVNGGASPTYQWYMNNVAQGTGSIFSINNATNGTAVYVTMTSNASCVNPQSVNSSTHTVNCIVTSLPPVDGLESFSIAPNPSRGMFILKLKLQRMKMVSVSVVDANGKKVYESVVLRLVGEHNLPVNLSRVAQGVYYVRTTVGDVSFVEKVLVIR